jgi:disulfide bond formation protein DsbB
MRKIRRRRNNFPYFCTYIEDKGRVFSDMKTDTFTNQNWTLLFICWLIACASTLGSIFFSEVMGYAPCSLCWYQRISLFPLVFILLAGLFPLSKHVVKFALPLVVSGWLISFYHNLIYSGFIPEKMQPCSQGVSCKEEYISLFGFITIPMLSLLAFTSIFILLVLLMKRISK